MKIYANNRYTKNTPKNCNNCIFRQNMSQHWDLEDYCCLNQKHTSKIIMEKDCPLKNRREKVHNEIKRTSSNYYRRK